jgi:hypothetical protein
VDRVAHHTRDIGKIAQSCQSIVDTLNVGLRMQFNSTGLTVWASNQFDCSIRLRDVLIGPLNLKSCLCEPDHNRESLNPPR